MAFMFYKVPSGLGIYFITSSTWQICERLLLPKITASQAASALALESAGGDKGSDSGDMNVEKPKGRFAQFWEKVLDEAQKNPTYRNLAEEKDRNNGGANGGNSGGRERDRDKDRDRNGRGSGSGPDRGKPRTRPGRGGR